MTGDRKVMADPMNIAARTDGATITVPQADPVRKDTAFPTASRKFRKSSIA
jgi:hypothetical protein